MGRRIFVRWDMTLGPDNRKLVVNQPKTATLTRRGAWNGTEVHFDQLYEAGKW
jgi:hypothetical protein